jgi:formiminotetrahydrofolate cyclodeaminase
MRNLNIKKYLALSLVAVMTFIGLPTIGFANGQGNAGRISVRQLMINNTYENQMEFRYWSPSNNGHDKNGDGYDDHLGYVDSKGNYIFLGLGKGNGKGNGYGHTKGLTSYKYYGNDYDTTYSIDRRLRAAKAAEALLDEDDYKDYGDVEDALSMSESTDARKIAKTEAIYDAIDDLILTVDAALEAAKDAEALLDEDDYEDYSDVLAALAMSESSDYHKRVKTEAIYDAIDKLVTKSSVDAALEAAKDAEALLDEDDYEDYSDVLAALAMSESSDYRKRVKTEAIYDAIDELVLTVDAALEAAKDAEASLDEDDYEDYSDVLAALAMPESTNAQKIAKTIAIYDAIDELVLTVDAELEAAKAEEALLDEDDYVDYSAVDDALAMPESTNAQKIAKTIAIYDAIDELVLSVDADLAAAKAEEALLAEGDYVDYSLVIAALAMAETTDEEKIAKTAAIYDAIDELVLLVDADLAAAKAEEALLVEGDYVDYSAVIAALAMAETTDEEKIAKTAAIYDAIDELVLSVDAELEAAKAVEALLVEGEYEDYSAVTAALEMDETTDEEKIAKTIAINEAIEGLVEVIDVELAAVNAAATSTEMRTALEDPGLGLTLTSYNGLVNGRKTQAAAAVLTSRGEGYVDVDAVQSALDVAVAELAK